jgi:hypothetical protein
MQIGGIQLHEISGSDVLVSQVKLGVVGNRRINLRFV